jgi:hypothetical protein
MRELAALFSLGVLTQHEAGSYEAHIRKGCPVCEAEYRKFKHITAEIGLAANEAVAPDYIRELILARIEREPPKTATAAEPEKEEAAAEKDQEPAPRPILSQPPGNKPGILPWVLVIVFAAAAGLLFYAYYSGQAANEELKAGIAAAQSEIKSLEASLDIQKGQPGELENIISVVSKPETRIFHMAGLAPAPAASGAILWDVQQNKCLVFGYIPPASSGKAYQLWYLTPTAKIPSGMLQPDSTGRIYGWFPIPEDISSLTMVITLEPKGGSKTPTLPYYAIGRND